MVNASGPTLVLVGPPGAGKSTIGRRVARALNIPLIDTDQIIAERFGRECGEVFADLGEEKFREIEADVITEVLDKHGVLSLGGGAVLTQATRESLYEHPVVWIDVSAEEGFRRTSRDQSRPVLAAEDRRGHYQKLLDDREALYREVSDFRVRSDSRSPQRLVAEILSFLDTL